ncbi:hypothetical protein [Desulfobulbus propionicus]
MPFVFAQKRLLRCRGFGLFVLLWVLVQLSTSWADEGDRAAVRVETFPASSFFLFKEVTVLPLRFADNRPALELTAILLEILDATRKYTLRQPGAGEKIPPLDLAVDSRAAVETCARRFANAACCRAVIGGVLVPEKTTKEGEKPASGAHRVILHLVDSERKEPVWTLTYGLDLGESLELFRSRTQQAVETLLDELIRNGDIFTTRLPPPVILSRKMVAGQARVVVLGEQQPGIAAYRLLRAEAVDAPLVPTGPDVVNSRHSLVLKDRQTPVQAPGWYTVIALDSRGLAGVPGPPFYLTNTAGSEQPASSGQ